VRRRSLEVCVLCHAALTDAARAHLHKPFDFLWGERPGAFGRIDAGPRDHCMSEAPSNPLDHRQRV
jgi:hypothetical protein